MDKNKYMVVKPDTFSGEGDIKNFFKQYEKAAAVNNWDDSEKVKFLSIFLKGTANTFLENLEHKNIIWTWDDLKSEFLKEFQPIGYSILLKNKLENRRQGDLESITSFVTSIENLCRQVETNMKEEDICSYILKGIREPILNAISLHDNSNLTKIKNNLKKYELMQFRINSRNSNINDYSDILNEQVLKLNKKSDEKEKEISELKQQIGARDKFYKKEIELLTEEIRNINVAKKTVRYNENRERNYNDRDRSFSRERNNREYKKSPYPVRQNYRNRETSTNRQNRERSLSRERQFYERRPREHSTDRDYKQNNNYEYRDNSRNDNREYRNRSYSRNRDNYYNNTYRNQRSRDSSRERTPERYERQTERGVICFRCDERGHYADQCTNKKND